ncbi:MAG TPA: response regulator transcription factor [Anaerolineaceae bacterium]|nr:response regulator transcription factor [Anaerolineaceae bacterium]HQL92382.1 response regulator transcription factor [Anaerolineaceae bacterium]
MENGLSVLLIEGKRRLKNNFAQELSDKGFDVTTVTSGATALETIPELMPNVVVINAMSLRTNGLRITNWIRTAWPDLPIILIIAEDEAITNAPQANVLLRLPFTVQKLINRLRLFNEVKHKHILKKGDLELNTQTAVAHYKDKEAHLTPRCSDLLRVMMEKPGKVLTRKELFSHVWDTDYTGDTRTLDVHISWLRNALEENPRQPELIQTIRGIGYKLNL